MIKGQLILFLFFFLFTTCTTSTEKIINSNEESFQSIQKVSLESFKNKFPVLSFPLTVPLVPHNWTLGDNELFTEEFKAIFSVDVIKKDFSKELVYDSIFNFNKFFSYKDINYYPLGRVEGENDEYFFIFYIDGDGELLMGATMFKEANPMQQFQLLAGLKGSQAHSPVTFSLVSEINEKDDWLTIDKQLEISDNIKGTVKKVNKMIRLNLITGEVNESSIKKAKEFFPSFISNFPELTLPVSIEPESLHSDSLVSIEPVKQGIFIKPYTTKISEDDYPYPFNYPDFSSNEYYHLGKITLNENIFIAIIPLFYSGYRFVGAIAYNIEGEILDGLMLGESEDGTGLSYVLTSKIKKSSNSIVINSSYNETQFGFGGENEKNIEIKKMTYTFNLDRQKFELVK